VRQTALELLQAALRAVEAKDLPAVLALLDDDSTLIDPHYPVPRMVGRAAITDGLRWAFGTIVTFRFELDLAYESADRRHAAVEVDCHHVLRGGRALEFRQVFVADAQGGTISRLQAYEPYGPGGLVGLVLKVTRLGRRLRRQGRR
jgi:ketosteroid isomerase-like protein